jgi:hypothetical protein
MLAPKAAFEISVRYTDSPYLELRIARMRVQHIDKMLEFHGLVVKRRYGDAFVEVPSDPSVELAPGTHLTLGAQVGVPARPSTRVHPSPAIPITTDGLLKSLTIEEIGPDPKKCGLSVQLLPVDLGPGRYMVIWNQPALRAAANATYRTGPLEGPLIRVTGEIYTTVKSYSVRIPIPRVDEQSRWAIAQPRTIRRRR